MILDSSRWCARTFAAEHADILDVVRTAADLDAARKALYLFVTERQYLLSPAIHTISTT